MLARLSGVAGVSCACVEPTGRCFIVTVTEGADCHSVGAQVIQILGPKSFRLDPPWDSEEMHYRPRGELWLDSATIRMLSMLEARILALRWAGAASTAAELGPDLSDRLAMVLRLELMRDLERAHESGGTSNRNWYRQDFAMAFERVMARLAPDLSRGQRAIVLDSLRQSLGAGEKWGVPQPA